MGLPRASSSGLLLLLLAVLVLLAPDKQAPGQDEADKILSAQARRRVASLCACGSVDFSTEPKTALTCPGEAIFCYNCTSATGYNCSTAEEACSSSVNSCITIARKEDSGAHETENPTYEKKCNSDDRLCNQFYGLLAGDFRMHWNSSCCRFDRCNIQEVIVQKASQKPNGVHCNSCFARGTHLCLNVTHVACTGLLTHCIYFATTAKKEEFKEEQVAFTGCATKNVCDMGAVALFASSQNVEVKANLCSGAPKALGQDGLALSLLAALPFLALWS